MKNLLLLFCICFAGQVAGQELKKKKNNLEGFISKEVYYVLKSDESIKQGEYTRFYKTGGLAAKGQYELNKPTGTWEFFEPRTGQLAQRYNYNHNNLEFAKPMARIKKIWIEENSTFIEKQPEELPALFGGDGRLGSHWGFYLRYPADALRNDVQGDVLVSATITTEGKMIDEKVEAGLGFGTNEEALRVIKLLPDEWIPAKVNKQSINSRVLLSVKFGLQ